jgi:hypothetical protein
MMDGQTLATVFSNGWVLAILGFLTVIGGIAAIDYFFDGWLKQRCYNGVIWCRHVVWRHRPLIIEHADDGQVPVNSKYYVERPPLEQECYKQIVQSSALLRIRATRQMGKSSLLVRALHYAEQQGYRTVYFSFQALDSPALAKLDEFLQHFCASIAYRLKLPAFEPNKHWCGVLGSKDKCRRYMDTYLLANKPLILGLDEVDKLFEYPAVAKDFFSMLRAWHEERNEAISQQLHLILTYAQESFPLLNINESPFNIGIVHYLPDFTPEQVTDLAKRHELSWQEPQITKLMSLVGGHPYLVRKAMYEVATGHCNLDKLLKTAAMDHGVYKDHLSRLARIVESDSKLKQALHTVLNSKTAINLDNETCSQLKTLGLVVEEDATAMVRISRPLYQEYFTSYLR